MDWSSILSTSPIELSAEQFEVISRELPTVDPNALNIDELRNFFGLNRFIIEHLSKDDHRSTLPRKSSLLLHEESLHFSLTINH